jgi:hypothetical protein
MTDRRDFLRHITIGAASLAIAADGLHAEPRQSVQGPWDTSWIDKISAAKYSVVIDTPAVNDGAFLDHAQVFLDNFHEVHGTTDAQTLPIAVVRHFGVVLGVNDAMWARYPIGEISKMDDPATHAPARRNIYWTATGKLSEDDPPRIDAMQSRGMITLVCNRALGWLGRQIAQREKLDPVAVQAEVRANVIPGGIRVPSGLYAVIRAQNAGCAFLRGE